MLLGAIFEVNGRHMQHSGIELSALGILSRLVFAALVAIVLSAQPVFAQEMEREPDLVALGLMAADTPAERLAEVESALADADRQMDPRFVFGLLQERVELLEALDDPRLGDALVAVARFAVRHRDLLQADPAPWFEQAADAYAETGRMRDALAALEMALDLRAAANAPGERLAALLERMAELAEAVGNEAAAERSRERAAALRTAPLAATDGGTRSAEEGFTEVEVFYATDRKRTGADEPSRFFGFERGDLQYGRAQVTIPNRHRPGAIEVPSIWRLEFGASPSRHVILQSVEPVPADAFFGAVSTRLQERGSDEAFIFVHGYNVTFEAAAKRAAQLAYDMKFAGVPVVYSWPSRGATTGYIADTAVVRLSGRRLSHFLEDFVRRSGARRVHLIAHSMGNRALTDALELLALRTDPADLPRPVFGQVVFAAPDVDAGLFAEMIRTIRPLALRQTLYASESDWALAVSRKLHGDAPRAGQGGESMLKSPVLDSIDMSELGQDMLAHGYFADESSALIDLMALFWRNAAPERRCGLEAVEDGGSTLPLWRYRTGVCQENALLGVLGHLRNQDTDSISAARETIAAIVSDEALADVVEPVVMRLIGE